MSDDRELIQKIQRGDLKAFTLLVKQYERLVFHVVYRLTPEQADAEDMCQEVFIKVHKRLNTFAFDSKLSTWIARIAYLTGIDYLKKYNKSNTSELTEHVERLHFTDETPEKIVSDKDVSDYMYTLIGQLPEQYKTVLSLYHLDEFSYQEIEQITGMPEGTVKSYLFRARKILKEKLEIYLKKEQ